MNRLLSDLIGHINDVMSGTRELTPGIARTIKEIVDGLRANGQTEWADNFVSAAAPLSRLWWEPTRAEALTQVELIDERLSNLCVRIDGWPECRTEENLAEWADLKIALANFQRKLARAAA